MQQTELRRLQSAYRAAWRHFVTAVELCRSEQPQSPTAQQAAFVAEQAKNLYRKRRNELADYILSNRRATIGSTKAPFNAGPQQASIATTESAAATTKNVCGSFGFPP